MKKIVPAVVLIVLCYSCNFLQKKKPADTLEDKIRMMDTDRAFSKMSEDKGMKAAFMEYIDSNGVLLKPGQYPVAGADAIDFLIQQDDSTYKLKWEPSKGIIAQSGDLGYTYGLYALKLSGKDTGIYGTYITIWKKQADGKWKFVLNSGNEGIDTESQVP
jgi:ketosteroid isomerase-like protein